MTDKEKMLVEQTARDLASLSPRALDVLAACDRYKHDGWVGGPKGEPVTPDSTPPDVMRELDGGRCWLAWSMFTHRNPLTVRGVRAATALREQRGLPPIAGSKGCKPRKVAA